MTKKWTPEDANEAFAVTVKERVEKYYSGPFQNHISEAVKTGKGYVDLEDLEVGLQRPVFDKLRGEGWNVQVVSPLRTRVYFKTPSDDSDTLTIEPSDTTFIPEPVVQPRSNAPLYFVIGILTLGLFGIALFVFTRPLPDDSSLLQNPHPTSHSLQGPSPVFED